MRPLSARVSRAIEAMEKLGHRGRCPACNAPILPSQRTAWRRGSRYHRRCLRYERKLG